MYLVALAWFYVALMMALAEAVSSQGTLLGALITFLLYGLLPIGLVLYVMGAPRRREARRRVERLELEALRRQRESAQGSAQGDGGDHAAAEPLAPVGKEP